MLGTGGADFTLSIGGGMVMAGLGLAGIDSAVPMLASLMLSTDTDQLV